MRPDKQNTKAFYKQAETGEVFVIERTWDGVILSSCKAKKPLKDLDSYRCNLDANLWLGENSDKLVMI